jgi:co-chaperonin GroES (HSP10)
MSRLLGNRVILVPVNTDLQKTASGVLVPKGINLSSPFYRVVAVGEGCWERRKGKPPRFIKPEVKVGDIVLSTLWRDEPLPGWHRAERGQREDERSDVVVDSRQILAVLEVSP